MPGLIRIQQQYFIVQKLEYINTFLVKVCCSKRVNIQRASALISKSRDNFKMKFKLQYVYTMQFKYALLSLASFYLCSWHHVPSS